MEHRNRIHTDNTLPDIPETFLGGICRFLEIPLDKIHNSRTNTSYTIQNLFEWCYNTVKKCQSEFLDNSPYPKYGNTEPLELLPTIGHSRCYCPDSQCNPAQGGRDESSVQCILGGSKSPSSGCLCHVGHFLKTCKYDCLLCHGRIDGH